MSTGASALRQALTRLAAGQDLSAGEAHDAIDQVIEGQSSEGELGALLGLLAVRGESAAIVAGAVRAVRKRMLPLDVPADLRPLLDTCGTGGDGSGSVNISSAVAIVVAACGVRVAKHGNRSASSRSGSSDVLAELGVRVDASPSVVLRCLQDVGIGFLYAPRYHPALRHAAAVRARLPFRTLFNLVGPLANPARADYQLIGVPDHDRARLLASTLAQLAGPAEQGGWPQKALVVWSVDGLDEVSLGAESRLHTVANGAVGAVEAVDAARFGLGPVSVDSLAVADPAHSAARIRSMLDADPGPVRDVVLANAAVALRLVGLDSDLRSAAERAGAAIDRGDARRVLERWAALSQTQDA